MKTTIPRWAIALATVFIGVAVGTGLVILSESRSAPVVTDRDIVTLVAHLYKRDRSIFNARERLAFLNRPAVELADVAADTIPADRPSAATDVEAIRSLGGALRQYEREISRESESGTSMLGVAIVLAAAALIGLAIFRALAYFGIGGRLIRIPPVRPENPNERPPRAPRTTEVLRPIATNLIDGTIVAERPSEPAASDRPRERAAMGKKVIDQLAQMIGRPRTPEVPISVPSPVPQRDRRRSQVDPVAPPPPISTSFQVDYEINSDNGPHFVHAITGSNGKRNGLCGVSLTESHDDGNRFYGLTVWIQQCADDRPEQFVTAGVMTPNADRRVAAGIALWRRERALSDLVPAEDGLEIRVATDDIAMVVRFGVIECNHDRDWMPDYFSRVQATCEAISVSPKPRWGSSRAAPP